MTAPFPSLGITSTGISNGLVEIYGNCRSLAIEQSRAAAAASMAVDVDIGVGYRDVAASINRL